MGKLELKHLVPYLPYGLKVFRNACISSIYDNGICELDCIGYVDKIVTFKKGPDYYFDYDENYFDIKPILRPMSDCEQLLNVENHIEVDSSILAYNKSVNSINIYPDGSEWTHSSDVYNNIYVYLFEHHFDVFGLIEKGLAIDINTLT